MFCCHFVLHTCTLEPTQLHIRARPKAVSSVRLHRSIPSTETKLNGDKLNYTTTRLLRPNVLVSDSTLATVLLRSSIYRQIYIYIYTHTHTQTHMHISTYVYRSVTNITITGEESFIFHSLEP